MATVAFRPQPVIRCTTASRLNSGHAVVNSSNQHVSIGRANSGNITPKNSKGC